VLGTLVWGWQDMRAWVAQQDARDSKREAEKEREAEGEGSYSSVVQTAEDRALYTDVAAAAAQMFFIEKRAATMVLHTMVQAVSLDGLSAVSTHEPTGVMAGGACIEALGEG
jgi:hypothetical protein